MEPELLLYRQVHPTFVQAGRVTSQAFRPTKKDNDRLSVYDSSLIDAPASFLHYTEQLELDSCGVLGITVGECETVDLVPVSDPVPFPEHVVIDFTGLSNGAADKKAKILRKLADARGWQYQPDP